MIDKRLLERQEEQVRVDMDPADAIKLVRRLRRVTFFLHTKTTLVTERLDNDRCRCYDLPESIDISARQAIKMLSRCADFNERKAATGKAVGRIEVTRLGDCLFLG